MTAGHINRNLVASAVFASAVYFAGTLVAQPVTATQEGSSASTVVYPAAFFAQYSPVSANDMIDRIPGVSISGGGGGRGMGSGGNLLVNGERLAGKSNSPRDQLARITARQVERIEIIRGNTAELDVRNASQVVNVVLLDTADGASITAEINSDLHRDGTVAPGGSLSYSGRNDNLDYMFNIMADPAYNHDVRTETGYFPDMVAKDTMKQDSINENTNYHMTVNLGYRLSSNDRIQLTGKVFESAHPTDIYRHMTTLSTPSAVVTQEHEHVDYDNRDWEIGSDYEHSFADSSRFQILFVANDRSRDNTRERFRIGDAREKTLFIDSAQRTRERIAQTSYSWQLGENQDMQLGLERAQTILDSSLWVASNSGSGAADSRFGGLQLAQGSSNPGTTVEEMRYEGFAIHNWTLNERMALESTLVYETSEISQSGQTSRSRDFDFLRPKLDYRFDLTPALQLRASVEHVVSQLSFSHFTASANTSDQDKTVNAGNPDLVQEKEMRYELNLEYRLPDDIGVLTSRFFYRDLEDVIGRMNVSDDPDHPVSALGNIGDGIRYGVYLDASTRLGFLGLPDAILTTGLNIYDSRIIDPILGQERRMNNRGRALLGFRQDVPSFNLNYGFTYTSEFNGGEKHVDIDSIEQYSSEPGLSMFVSKVLFDDITFRLESNNTLNSRNCRDRFRYSGHTAAGVLSEVEKSCNGSGQKLALKLRTTF